MRKVIPAALLALAFQATAGGALDSGGNSVPSVVVTPLTATTVTADGQPIVLPQKNAQVLVSIFDIPVGASLPVHKHPYPRYAYVLAGSLRVTASETGKANIYNAGDFIVEMIGRWHQGANAGSTPVRLLVIDQVEEGAHNTVLR